MIRLVLLTLLHPMAPMPAPAPFALQAVIVLAGALLLTLLGGWLIGWFLQPFQAQLNKKFRPNRLRPVSGLKEGGRYIGYLERLLIFVFILSGQFAGVGFLITAKSILRFGELKDSENRKQAEYIIIGTFASFLYAILISLLARWLLASFTS